MELTYSDKLEWIKIGILIVVGVIIYRAFLSSV